MLFNQLAAGAGAMFGDIADHCKQSDFLVPGLAMVGGVGTSNEEFVAGIKRSDEQMIVSSDAASMSPHDNATLSDNENLEVAGVKKMHNGAEQQDNDGVAELEEKQDIFVDRAGCSVDEELSGRVKRDIPIYNCQEMENIVEFYLLKTNNDRSVFTFTIRLREIDAEEMRENTWRRVGTPSVSDDAGSGSEKWTVRQENAVRQSLNEALSNDLGTGVRVSGNKIQKKLYIKLFDEDDDSSLRCRIKAANISGTTVLRKLIAAFQPTSQDSLNPSGDFKVIHLVDLSEQVLWSKDFSRRYFEMSMLLLSLAKCDKTFYQSRGQFVIGNGYKEVEYCAAYRQGSKDTKRFYQGVMDAQNLMDSQEYNHWFDNLDKTLTKVVKKPDGLRDRALTNRELILSIWLNAQLIHESESMGISLDCITTTLNTLEGVVSRVQGSAESIFIGNLMSINRNKFLETLRTVQDDILSGKISMDIPDDSNIDTLDNQQMMTHHLQQCWQTINRNSDSGISEDLKTDAKQALNDLRLTFEKGDSCDNYWRPIAQEEVDGAEDCD